MTSITASSATTGDDEDSIIRHRLLTHTAGARGEPPLNKVAKAYVFDVNVNWRERERFQRNKGGDS